MKKDQLWIGFSSGLMYPDANRTIFNTKTLCYIEKEMAHFFAEDHVIPLLIPDLPIILLFIDLALLFFFFQYQSFNWRFDLPTANPVFQIQKPFLNSDNG